MIKSILRALIRQFLDLAWGADLLDGTSYLRARYPHLRPLLVVEVGARFGEDTALLAASWPQARVLAFECNPPALQVAAPLLAHLPTVTLLPHALGAAEDIVAFHSVGIHSNAGASSLLPLKPGAAPVAGVDPAQSQTIEVRVRRLDTVVAELHLPAPELIWMDVEGAEVLVLTGAGTLLDDVRVVYTEVALKELREGQSGWRDIRALLARHGLTERRPWIRWLRQMLGSPTMNIVFERLPA